MEGKEGKAEEPNIPVQDVQINYSGEDQDKLIEEVSNDLGALYISRRDQGYDLEEKVESQVEAGEVAGSQDEIGIGAGLKEAAEEAEFEGFQWTVETVAGFQDTVENVAEFQVETVVGFQAGFQDTVETVAEFQRKVETSVGFQGIGDVAGFQGTVEGFQGTKEKKEGFKEAEKNVAGLQGTVETLAGIQGAVGTKTGFQGAKGTVAVVQGVAEAVIGVKEVAIAEAGLQGAEGGFQGNSVGLFSDRDLDSSLEVSRGFELKGNNSNKDLNKGLNIEMIRDKIGKNQIEEGKEIRRSVRRQEKDFNKVDIDIGLKDKNKIGSKKEKKGKNKEDQVIFTCEICQREGDHVSQCDMCGKWMCIECAEMESRGNANRIAKITEEYRINWNCTTCEK